MAHPNSASVPGCASPGICVLLQTVCLTCFRHIATSVQSSDSCTSSLLVLHPALLLDPGGYQAAAKPVVKLRFRSKGSLGY